MQQLRIISFSHQNLGIDQVGWMYLDASGQALVLPQLKHILGLDELMYVATCNRVEFIGIATTEIDVEVLMRTVNPALQADQLEVLKQGLCVRASFDAASYLFRVACSLESMVVGEREIITQIKQAYTQCVALGISGDALRMLAGKTIETAKKVYTQTEISRHAVSVMSVAYERMLSKMSVSDQTHLILVGAGQTMHAFARLIVKKGIKKVSVFNRSIENAAKIASIFPLGKGYALSELPNFKEDFQGLVSCTGSDAVVVEASWLSAHNTGTKVVVDLAIPFDVDRAVLGMQAYQLIDVDSVKARSNANIEKRKTAIAHCMRLIESSLEEFKDLVRERKVELAMQAIPERVKALKSFAVEELFAKDIEGLDATSKEVLDKVLAYMEKKYISEPMKMAKQIMLERII